MAIRRGQVHGFTNVADRVAKVQIWMTPAGFEKFIVEVGTRAAAVLVTPPRVTPSDLEKLVAAAPAYGIEIVPPPAT